MTTQPQSQPQQDPQQETEQGRGREQERGTERERRYEGPAILVLDDAETEVTAELTAYVTEAPESQWKWCGLVKTDNPLEDFAHFAQRPTVIRLAGTGRESEVLLHGWGSQWVRVEGSGDVPF
ncbi:DUF4873 domain-containing protein [Streptomyces sp. ODS28]|uniref:DUF4873 domain-containing protein n=1 Tax=Streptomyces sp. ODS28 TaxID=3136688 RepID=UPI0031EBAB71